MSFARFTEADYAIIDKEYSSLKELAAGRCRNDRELELVQKAFDFANQAHKDVRRRSGEPYMLHPIQVAKIVVSEIGLGYKSICAALLHDVVEDTNYSQEDIQNHFGDKIASLVEGLTKIKTVLDNEDRKGGENSGDSLQAENFKRILLTLGDDIRVVLIKLADRLHNCRTIEHMPEHKMDKILAETMFIFIPLAHRLGLYSIKSEMENIWLKYKEPQAYNEISEKTQKNTASRERDIDEFIAPIEKALKEAGFKFKISKRIKTPYSIWYKMRTKKVPFEEIFDLYAVRIIFEPDTTSSISEKNQAYIVYATVVSMYNENYSRRRDWIARPKSNGYEALHCTLMSKAGFWVEVQVRSTRMDSIAEKGIAAHWSYKNDGYVSDNDEEMTKWLSNVQEILLSKDVSALELLDLIHNDLLSSDIIVFTPKGEQKNIINGATALDFAYMIHSKVGAGAIAAKVNMRLVPLSHQLKAGDQVEIITASNTSPKMEWLQFLKTRHARNKVIEYFRNDRKAIAAKGEQIFDERLRLTGHSSSNELIRRFISHIRVHDAEELYFRVGLGILGPEEFKAIIDEGRLGGDEKKKFVIRKDEENIKYKLADCCNPIPGDPIVGFFSGEDTVIVHKKSCHVAERLASYYGNRVVVPHWTGATQEYPTRISLKGLDQIGLLNKITEFISRTLGINMRKLTLNTDNGIFEGQIELLVKDKSILDDMVKGLKKIDGITDVVRTDI